ncbi:MAG: DNA mismatch repair protein MutL, partial [Faecousia sp.]
LEEAYRNQIMVGKFPACVLHLTLPASAVDVNVHPAKTEVKFLSEKAVFDCVHYGVLGALNKQPDRPEVQFKKSVPAEPVTVGQGLAPAGNSAASRPGTDAHASAPKKESFFRTMTPEEYKTFSAALKDAPQPRKETAAATLGKIERTANMPLREFVTLPQMQPKTPAPATEVDAPIAPASVPDAASPTPNVGRGLAPAESPAAPEEMEQTALDMPAAPEWRLVGELYNTYIIVEQGEDAFLIDKHAAHERILFEKLKANQEKISAQALLTPVPVRLSPSAASELLANKDMLDELGFEIDEFGENTVLLRQIPMDLSPETAADALESLAADLLNGRREHRDTVRDELLHTVACKAAIKAGWVNDEKELLAVAEEVMSREELKYCPHGRPICVSLSKKQLEKQFKRT